MLYITCYITFSCLINLLIVVTTFTSAYIGMMKGKKMIFNVLHNKALNTTNQIYIAFNCHSRTHFSNEGLIQQ